MTSSIESFDGATTNATIKKLLVKSSRLLATPLGILFSLSTLRLKKHFNYRAEDPLKSCFSKCLLSNNELRWSGKQRKKKWIGTILIDKMIIKCHRRSYDLNYSRKIHTQRNHCESRKYTVFQAELLRTNKDVIILLT